MAAMLQLFRRKPVEQPVVEFLSTSISIKTSPKHEFVGHEHTVWSSVFLQDNVHIVSGSIDGTMRKWNCETGMLVGEPWKVDSKVCAMALSPDGKTIACGRSDGCVQQWDTNGQMQGTWTGHTDYVESLTWSPSGQRLASASSDGTILIRKSESGEVEAGPIKANQGWVWSVAYSPSGDRIASGGSNSTCIWDTNTGDLLVGPIEGTGYSVLWSLDGSKLYSGGQFGRVLDSTSGTELHRFHLDKYLYSIALSPKHNLLAGVGQDGTAQLWDTESYQPLGQLFRHESSLFFVSFSSDGQYLAYGGRDNKVTLRMVKDNVPELPTGTALDSTPKSMPQTPLSEVDATNPFAKPNLAVDDDDEHKDPYNNFFTSSHSSLPSPLPIHSPMRHLKRARSLLHLPKHRFTPLHVPCLLSRRALSVTPLHAPIHSDQTKPPRGDSRAAIHNEQCGDVSHPENVAPETTKLRNTKGKRRGEPIPHKPASTHNLSSSAGMDTNENRVLWKLLFHAPKTDGRKASMKVPQEPSPGVVEIYAVRGFRRLVPHRQKRRVTSLAQKPSASAAPSGAGGSSQAGPSLQAGPPSQVGPSSQGHAGPSQSLPIVGSVGGSRPTRTKYTDNDSCSDSSIQAPCLKFLEKICYPYGRYLKEDT